MFNGNSQFLSITSNAENIPHKEIFPSTQYSMPFFIVFLEESEKPSVQKVGEV
jgi:hypothetical protein